MSAKVQIVFALKFRMSSHLFKNIILSVDVLISIMCPLFYYCNIDIHFV